MWCCRLPRGFGFLFGGNCILTCLSSWIVYWLYYLAVFLPYLNQRQKKSHCIDISPHISVTHRHHQDASLLIIGSDEQNNSLQVHLLKWHQSQHENKMDCIYFNNTYSWFNCEMHHLFLRHYIFAFKMAFIFSIIITKTFFTLLMDILKSFLFSSLNILCTILWKYTL